MTWTQTGLLVNRGLTWMTFYRDDLGRPGQQEGSKNAAEFFQGTRFIEVPIPLLYLIRPDRLISLIKDNHVWLEPSRSLAIGQ
jgi:hypothetical protein